MPATAITVRDLRRSWKPHKERLGKLLAEHPTTIRFHRACSWMQRGDQATSDDLDLALLCQWIAFNALYGQWNPAGREPLADCECWKEFLERMLRLDRNQYVVDVLVDHKPLVMCIYEDQFLSRYFWQEPSPQRAKRSRQTMFDARTWFIEGRWIAILESLCERIYFIRCQLVHGASTYQSSLNRETVRHCSVAMRHLLGAFLQVWIHFGADEDWGAMCYPPLRAAERVR